MIAALLPVKSFTRSKERLAGFLTPSERAELARTMFEDVWAALRQAQSMGRGLDDLVVITAEPYVLSRCQRENIACMEEAEQLGHSDSVTRATQWAMSLGTTSLLSVPIDTPGVTPAEILELLDLGRKFPVVVVPSADGSGTNALLRTPPDVIQPRFGPGSCHLHVQQAEERGSPHLIFRSPGLMGDIDTPEDLQIFTSAERPCQTHALARKLLAVDRGAASCR